MRRVLIVAAVLSAGVILATTLVWLSPRLFPGRFQADIERAAAPCIAAIEAYTKRVGHPPVELRDLLPEYDAASAGTGFPPQREFWYAVPIVPGQPPGRRWSLSISVGGLIKPNSKLLQYDSASRSWRVSERGRR
ncbi:MAG: hypothetical protein JNL28_01215 [Planctomycetes bacterium]|nr:hypothetical protein [Planctomycetota bacterium]